EPSERDGVGRDHPLQPRLGEMEVVTDRRERDVDDRYVEHGHEERDADEREGLPALRVRYSRGHGCCLHLRAPPLGSRSIVRGRTAEPPIDIPAQWRKWRRPVKAIAAPAFATAAITSSSRREPPGWTIEVAPASSAICGPSGNGKNASEASADPAGSWPNSAVFSTAIRTASTRLIWPAPIPIVCRSFTSTIAFDATCLQTRHAKTRSPHCGSLSSPVTSCQVSRSSISASGSWTSIPPSTRL